MRDARTATRLLRLEVKSGTVAMCAAWLGDLNDSKRALMKGHELRFVTSMTVCPSDMEKIERHVEMAGVDFSPLKSVLVTPLFMNPASLKKVRRLAAAGTEVFFDSGGYYVQTGRLTYEELYMPLLQFYKENQWGSVYTLPDHVPTSQDSDAEVDRKVNDTVLYSTLLFHELPYTLRNRAMPVVHGRSFRHADQCLDAYIALGVNRIGFGSFGTAGHNSEINVATGSAVTLAKYVIDVAHANGMLVHIFGIDAPALVAMLKGIGADSFDSSSWLKAAGFGQVFLPLMRAYNISHRITVSELQKGITASQFLKLRALTEHQCCLCRSIPALQDHKMHRAVHNLIAIQESVDIMNHGKIELAQRIYRNGSPRYRQEYDKWLLQP